MQLLDSGNLKIVDLCNELLFWIYSKVIFVFLLGVTFQSLLNFYYDILPVQCGVNVELIFKANEYGQITKERVVCGENEKNFARLWLRTNMDKIT